MQLTLAYMHSQAILGMSCPPRSFFGHLRAVGDRFAQQKALHDSTIDDVVDFLCAAMPDVLVERAMDVCVCTDGGVDDSLYALIDDCVPCENPFWEKNGDMGFRKLRKLHVCVNCLRIRCQMRSLSWAMCALRRLKLIVHQII